MKINPNLKILVVDDCLDTRNYIKTILRKRGFKRVLGAHDAMEALDVMSSAFKEYEPVSLVLADWQMPEIDGLNFLTKVRLDQRYKEVPFIMVTADSDRDHVVQAINYGVDHYVIKPIRPEKLLEVIGHTLEIHPPPYGD